MSPIATTGHGIVYPDSTGNVNLWEHLQLLAESVETALDANELDGGWVAVGGGVLTGTLQYRKYRGIVYVQVDGAATTTSGVALTLNPSNALPSDVRPATQARVGAYFAGYAGIITVATTGDITAVQVSGSSKGSVSGILSYPLG